MAIVWSSICHRRTINLVPFLFLAICMHWLQFGLARFKQQRATSRRLMIAVVIIPDQAVCLFPHACALGLIFVRDIKLYYSCSSYPGLGITKHSLFLLRTAQLSL